MSTSVPKTLPGKHDIETHSPSILYNWDVNHQHKTIKPSLQGGGNVVVDSLLIVTPIVGFCNYCSMFCCALLCVHSSFAIIWMGKRELIVLFC